MKTGGSGAIPGTPSVHSGKGSSKGEATIEKRGRTITFGSFPTDTKAEVIKKFIDGIVTEAQDDIEETFAFGKKRSERGGARFKPTDTMWKYMTANAGGHRHIFNETTTIYCNVDSAAERKTGEEDRVKAVRKVVRPIIEKNGRNGSEVKKDLDTNYTKGIVWWKDERVAEWSAPHNKMQLQGWAKQHEEAFAQLMETRKQQ